MGFASATFHPVGQGLFVSGVVEYGEGSSFSWVYDCGSVSAAKYLIREIDRIHASTVLEMVCISHFDKDHISGIRLLLGRQDVRLIVLPYMPLVQRMLLAVDANANGWYLRFLVDPATYLLSIAPRARIVFIQGGIDKNEEQINSVGDTDIVFPKGEPLGEDDRLLVPGGNAPNASVVSHSNTAKFHDVWEFHFYNEQIDDARLNKLRDRVIEILTKNRIGSTRFSSNLIDELRSTYGSICGTNKNRISLVMYAGPLNLLSGNRPYVSLSRGRTSALHLQIAHCRLRGELGHRFLLGYEPSVVNIEPMDSPVLLLTGDISLKTKPRIVAVIKHFGRDRWRRISVLQVPHHGAASSWRLGSTAVFHHQVSVMSAGQRNKFGHPHREVFADLMTRGPIHVHEELGLCCMGWF